MPRIALDGQVIHYQQIGQGPDLILVHGLYCNIAFWWFRIAPVLAETHRVMAFDLRGHGFSAMPPAGYRAVDLSADVIGLMDHLDIPTAHLLGHSFGGAVAMAAALRAPDRVTRLTLADAWLPSLQARPPLADRAGWPRLRRRLAARGLTIGSDDMPRVVQGFLQEVLESAPPGDGDSDLSAMLSAVPVAGNRRQRPPRALRRWRELMAHTSARSEFRDPAGLGEASLGTLTGPVRLIYGARSRYLACRDALVRLLPESEVVTLPQAGHYFPVLRPEALLAALGQDAGAVSVGGIATGTDAPAPRDRPE